MAIIFPFSSTKKLSGNSPRNNRHVSTFITQPSARLGWLPIASRTGLFSTRIARLVSHCQPHGSVFPPAQLGWFPIASRTSRLAALCQPHVSACFSVMGNIISLPYCQTYSLYFTFCTGREIILREICLHSEPIFYVSVPVPEHFIVLGLFLPSPMALPHTIS